ncbi:hypothetical protein Pelo_13998 [Pelomyxa schiedti]|nr:hypothetical protein Pelo_13998 [Pelomyxa schiedti]
MFWRLISKNNKKMRGRWRGRFRGYAQEPEGTPPRTSASQLGRGSQRAPTTGASGRGRARRVGGGAPSRSPAPPPMPSTAAATTSTTTTATATTCATPTKPVGASAVESGPKKVPPSPSSFSTARTLSQRHQPRASCDPASAGAPVSGSGTPPNTQHLQPTALPKGTGASGFLISKEGAHVPIPQNLLVHMKPSNIGNSVPLTTVVLLDLFNGISKPNQHLWDILSLGNVDLVCNDTAAFFLKDIILHQVNTLNKLRSPIVIEGILVQDTKHIIMKFFKTGQAMANSTKETNLWNMRHAIEAIKGGQWGCQDDDGIPERSIREWGKLS